jgi:hypothetical protein
VPRRYRRFRPTTVSVAFALYDVWRRLPPRQRQQLMRIAREQGPKVAAKVMQRQRTRRGRRR